MILLTTTNVKVLNLLSDKFLRKPKNTIVRKLNEKKDYIKVYRKIKI